MGWLDLLAAQGTLQSLLQRHSWKASVLQRSPCLSIFPVTARILSYLCPGGFRLEEGWWLPGARGEAGGRGPGLGLQPSLRLLRRCRRAPPAACSLRSGSGGAARENSSPPRGAQVVFLLSSPALKGKTVFLPLLLGRALRAQTSGAVRSRVSLHLSGTPPEFLSGVRGPGYFPTPTPTPAPVLPASPSRPCVRGAPAVRPAGVDEACPPGPRRHAEPRGGLSARRRRGQGPPRPVSPGWGRVGLGRGVLSGKALGDGNKRAPRWEAEPPRLAPREEGHGPGQPPAVTRAPRPGGRSGRTAPVGRGFRRTVPAPRSIPGFLGAPDRTLKCNRLRSCVGGEG
ncbi:translation initiation factor IF-2-like [Cervus canadensis]|uniref:translation initiation factor IF-2-like n=1 Tax=Cervus canadensis TaxID=1574408 RepID=UPI001CA37C8F|nr:translation initiation factor IF-2-like [Cervus canadensis]